MLDSVLRAVMARRHSSVSRLHTGLFPNVLELDGAAKRALLGGGTVVSFVD